MSAEPNAPTVRNRCDFAELSGAFGDLGTLVPFVVAYLAIVKMDPAGVLLGFGGAMIATGLAKRIAEWIPRPALLGVVLGLGLSFMPEGIGMMSGSAWLAAALLAFALLAVTSENNRLFPDRPVTEKGVAISTGIANAWSSAIGGVPMCHGAGGMAGHVKFGARSGGATVMGGVLLTTAAFTVIHVGVAVVFGILAYHASKRGWLRP